MGRKDVEGPKPPKRDFAVLYLALLTSRIGFGVIIILFPSYITGASDISAAVALALYPMAEAVAALPIGRYCDTGGRKVVFMVALGYIAVLMLAIGLTRNYYVVSSIHALMGIGAAGVTVASLTMVTDLTETRNRGRGMGAFDFSNVGGYALGLVIGGVVLKPAFSEDLGSAFFVTGLMVAAAFVVARFVLEEPAHPKRATDRSLNPFKALDPMAEAVLPIWLGVTVLLGMVFFLPRAFSGAGFGGGLTALIFVVGLAVLGAGAVGFGALSDVVGRGKVMLIGVSGLFGLLLSLAVSFADGYHSFYRSLPLVGLFALLTSALVPTILATAGDRAAADRRGSAMGLYSVMLSGGTAVGTLVAGAVHSASGLTGIFEAAVVLFTVACLGSLALWLRARAKAPKPL
jgi:MFS family permease